jgi:two-component system OmpR family response regulator
MSTPEKPKNLHILLAEDDASIRSIAEMSLTRVGGHQVTAVTDGAQALAKLEEQSFDLILLDIMMPGLDGFETCRRIKASDTTSAMPVIFLTARAQAHEMQQGLSLGAVGYIIKPFDPMILPEQINEILLRCLDGNQAA